VIAAPSNEMDLDSPANQDEAELLAAALLGETKACERLVKEHGPRMLAVAQRILRHESDAADAVQDAFITAWRKLDTFRADCRLSTWLHRVTVNAALMRLRSQRRRDETLQLDARCSEPRGEETEAWMRISADETRELVHRGIERLSEPYRTILRLRDIEEIDTATVAQMLGCTIANAKTRLHRARQALRELLEPYVADRN
jgi:RNA polymerase sigma-70 factor, ECF subfamily